MRIMEQPLFTSVGFHQRDLLVRAAGEFQITQAFLVDWKNPARRAILRRHIGDGRAIRQRQILQARTKVLDKLSNYSVLTQHFSYREYEIRRSRPFAQPA